MKKIIKQIITMALTLIIMGTLTINAQAAVKFKNCNSVKAVATLGYDGTVTNVTYKNPLMDGTKDVSSKAKWSMRVLSGNPLFSVRANTGTVVYNINQAYGNSVEIRAEYKGKLYTYVINTIEPWYAGLIE